MLGSVVVSHQNKSNDSNSIASQVRQLIECRKFKKFRTIDINGWNWAINYVGLALQLQNETK